MLLLGPDPVLRGYLRRVLSDFEVYETGSVGEARRLFEEIFFTAVISDFRIINSNGLAVRIWVRHRSPIPFLLTSGGALGLSDMSYLVEPFRPQHLWKSSTG